MDKQKLGKLESALHESWSAETSSSPNWDKTNPSLGQCSVTSCVIQDYLGGDVLNCIATFPNGSTVSHYVNFLDGDIIDLTCEQFPKGTTFSEAMPKTKGFSVTRDYCLSFPDTLRRYEILKNKVRSLMTI